MEIVAIRDAGAAIVTNLLRVEDRTSASGAQVQVERLFPCLLSLHLMWMWDDAHLILISGQGVREQRQQGREQRREPRDAGGGQLLIIDVHVIRVFGLLSVTLDHLISCHSISSYTLLISSSY